MSPSPLFHNRREAGERLAQAVQVELKHLQTRTAASPVVFALPRGGVPVAEPVAERLGCPLDIVVAKKITQPENPELAIGAVTADGHVLWSAHRMGSTPSDSYEVALQKAKFKARSQMEQLACGCPRINPSGKIAILVDDGIATGMTMAVAVQALRAQQAGEVWLCAPVAPMELMDTLEQWGDRVIVLATPSPFYSVSRFYREFAQVETTIALAHLQQYYRHFREDTSPLPDPEEE
ncbi:phosphoribosyltransferase [Leptolyngbya sp. 'hensonii']|uniref:phosphoribosyltransferase n=1 Tax=Leptolyngbya sp. 'hensonii' TaxID=1922337 RepID=UPI00094F8CC6|nr:phosphoribosyltransferase family protein [Leptolyngbya sp. 'hensonii']OLP16907.1 phosphoribosyltransferase [Leptolyngbya sp. 'hensonii']